MKYLYVSIFITVLSFFGFITPFRNATQWIFTPFQFGLKNLAADTEETVSFFTVLNGIRKDNIILTQENMDLQSRIVELKKAEEENRVLKDQLGIKTSTGTGVSLMANVMGNPDDLTGSSFIIDKGSRTGVNVGDTLVTGNYLVGIVRVTYAERSIADFVISPNVSVAVMDLDSGQKTEGLAEGQYGSSILMTRILPTEQINIGDMIVTSGKDGLVTPGLVVGKISKLNEVPTDPLKSAYLETLFDLTKISKVFVLIK